MAYTFDAYREGLGANWFNDDPFLVQVLKKYLPKYNPDSFRDFGRRAATSYRTLVHEAARVENQPRLINYDGYHNRVDEVRLCAQSEQILKEIYQENLAVGDGGYLGGIERYAKLYLMGQNGEGGNLCSVACSDGAARVIRAFAGDERLQKILAQMERRLPPPNSKEYCHGAQFVTEIQGGSDVGKNEVVAKQEGGQWRLTGPKWFCSNIIADYFIMTARPEGAPAGIKGVALFVVPAYGTDGKRNGYTIDRLKQKFGSQSLPTAEVTFDGAVAYAVGPIERGAANLLTHVLSTSRFHVFLHSAAFLRAAEREATAYTKFREAFGRPLAAFPLVKKTLEDLGRARQATLAGVFRLHELWQGEGARPAGAQDKVRKVDVRILLMLAKVFSSIEARNHLTESIILLGGNGIEEEFTDLTRYLRDALINEIWEGPHNLLVTNALDDLQRFIGAEGISEFLKRTLNEVPPWGRELQAVVTAAAQEDRTVDFWPLGRQIYQEFIQRSCQDIR